MNSRNIVGIGFVTVIAGLFLLVIGSLQGGSGSTGGFVLIGPFPIVFGTGPNGGELAILSLVVGGIMILLLLLFFGRIFTLTREGRSETDK
jgi:uncharacterized membrane protein